MALPNIFTPQVANGVIERINKLTPQTLANWGKMNVSQMFAHCNVTYEVTYENILPKPNFFMRFMLKNVIKNIVVSEKPFKKNIHTAPEFIIKSDKDFNKEKERLINYITKTQQLGEATFEGKENISFGKLSATEWNNMFYKHLNHHLEQFGV
jgi:hypothetical protein